MAKGFNNYSKDKLFEAFRNLKVSNIDNSSSIIKYYIASSSLPFINLIITIIEIFIDYNNTAN